MKSHRIAVVQLYNILFSHELKTSAVNWFLSQILHIFSELIKYSQMAKIRYDLILQ